MSVSDFLRNNSLSLFAVGAFLAVPTAVSMSYPGWSTQSPFVEDYFRLNDNVEKMDDWMEQGYDSGFLPLYIYNQVSEIRDSWDIERQNRRELTSVGNFINNQDVVHYSAAGVAGLLILAGITGKLNEIRSRTQNG